MKTYPRAVHRLPEVRWPLPLWSQLQPGLCLQPPISSPTRLSSAWSHPGGGGSPHHCPSSKYSCNPSFLLLQPAGLMPSCSLPSLCRPAVTLTPLAPFHLITQVCCCLCGARSLMVGHVCEGMSLGETVTPSEEDSRGSADAL